MLPAHPASAVVTGRTDVPSVRWPCRSARWSACRIKTTWRSPSVVDEGETSAFSNASTGIFQECRLDRSAPARVVGVDHLLGAGGAACDDLFERSKKAGLVIAFAVLAASRDKSRPRNPQHLACHFAQCSVAKSGGKSLSG